MLIILTIFMHHLAFQTLPRSLLNLAAMFGISILVDWAKHAFIMKNSKHDPISYEQFPFVFAKDYAVAHLKSSTTELNKRLGMSPLPYLALFLCVSLQTIRKCIEKSQLYIVLPLFAVIFFLLKVLSSIVVLGQSSKIMRRFPREKYPNLKV